MTDEFYNLYILTHHGHQVENPCSIRNDQAHNLLFIK